MYSITLIIDNTLTQTIPLQSPVSPPTVLSVGSNVDLENEDVPLTYALIADVKLLELNEGRYLIYILLIVLIFPKIPFFKFNLVAYYYGNKSLKKSSYLTIDNCDRRITVMEKKLNENDIKLK